MESSKRHLPYDFSQSLLSSSPEPPAKRPKVTKTEDINSSDSVGSRSPSRPQYSAKYGGQEEEHWSIEDDILLKTIAAPELSLWKACARLMNGMTPVDLLSGFRVDQKHENYRDVLWPEGLCRELRALVCCPALQNPKLLCFAIQKAMHCRLSKIRAPIQTLLLGTRNDKVIEELKAQFPGVFDNKTEKLALLLNNSLGNDLPPHSGFLKHIRGAVIAQATSRGRYTIDPNTTALLARDLKSVSAAWDEYAQSDDHLLELRTIKEYSTISGHKRKSIGTLRVLELKKEAIIEKRKQQQTKSRGEEAEAAKVREIAKTVHSNGGRSHVAEKPSTRSNPSEASDVDLGGAPWSGNDRVSGEEKQAHAKKVQNVNVISIGSDSYEERSPLSKISAATGFREHNHSNTVRQGGKPTPRSNHKSARQEVQKASKPPRHGINTASQASQFSSPRFSSDSPERNRQHSLTRDKERRPMGMQANTSQYDKESQRSNSHRENPSRLPNSSTKTVDAGVGGIRESQKSMQSVNSSLPYKSRRQISSQSFSSSEPLYNTHAPAPEHTPSSVKQEETSYAAPSLSSLTTAPSKRVPSLADMLAERREKTRAAAQAEGEVRTNDDSGLD